MPNISVPCPNPTSVSGAPLRLSSHACAQPPQAAAEAQDPFAQLVALVMLPPLRTAITNAWQAREPEALLQWLDLWQPLMPPALLHELLTSQVFPKVRLTAHPIGAARALRKRKHTNLMPCSRA